MPKSKEFLETSDSDEPKSSKRKKLQSSTKENQTNEPAEDVTIGPNGERLYEIGKLRFISVSHFKGKPYINIREYYDDNGVQKPGKKGISLPVDQWEKFKDFIQQVDQDLKKSK